MDKLRQDVFEYLAKPGNKERREALDLLIGSNWFGQKDEELARKYLADWIDSWEKDSKFCQSGIDRARKHFGLEPPFKTHKVQITMELDVAICSEDGALGKDKSGMKLGFDNFGVPGSASVFGLEWGLANDLFGFIVQGERKSGDTGPDAGPFIQPIKILKATPTEKKVIK